jgi:GH25 family lysozyme M1 (1,4-beta-N-acetylmuramidase)
VRPFPKAPADYPCILGVDLGEPQGHDVNFAALVEAECSFAVLRLTDGLHDIDPTFRGNATRATAEGLYSLAYAVYEPYPVRDAVAQAEHALEVVDGFPIDIIACDLELAGRRTGAEIATGARRWCERIREAGKLPLVYIGRWFVDWIDQHDGVPGMHPDLVALAAENPLWLPRYTGTYVYPDAPAPWTGQPFMWQATGDHKDTKGRIISANYATLPGMPREIVVDTNIFPDTLDALRAAAGELASGRSDSPVQG